VTAEAVTGDAIQPGPNGATGQARTPAACGSCHRRRAYHPSETYRRPDTDAAGVNVPPHVAGRVSQREASAVEHSSLLSPERPAWPVTAVSAAAMAAVFTAAVMARHRGWGMAVTPIAALVAYSRVRTRAHWPTDVAAGGSCGAMIGAAVHRVSRR